MIQVKLEVKGGMYKNQLQELAQRSCFTLPSYTCIREGPDHAPRFKALVNFNGDTFESPHYCSTLRQAEHSAAEVALHSLSTHHSLAARILVHETGVYKNLLQEIAQRVGAPLPHYTTYRSGLGHLPVFTGTVKLAAVVFTGEPAKNKKQAEKNAAMAAWSSLKQLAKESASSSSEPENTDELEQITIARALIYYRSKEKVALADSRTGSIPFLMKFSSQSPRPTSPLPSPAATSKILPLIYPRSSRNRFSTSSSSSESSIPLLQSASLDSRAARPRFPAAGASPYVSMRSFRTTPCRGMAPPVTIRSAIPVFSAPPRPPPQRLSSPMGPPVCIRQAVPTFAAPTAPKVDAFASSVQKEPQASPTIAPVDKQFPTAEAVISVAPSNESVRLAKERTLYTAWKKQGDSKLVDVAVQNLKELKM